MGNQTIIPSMDQQLMQSALNGQGRLILAVVPALAEQSLRGTPLTEAGSLTVAGVYRCLIPLAGMVSTLEVHLTATIGASTATTDLDTLYWVENASDPTTWTKKTAGSGDGALTTTTLQASTITTLRGEQYAVMDITLGASPTVTFTRAEWNGI